MKWFCVACFSLLFLSTSAQQKDEIAIRKILNAQTLAWNRGNLDGFMKGYWQSDSLLFIGKNGPTYGYANTLQNYKKSYADTAAMGKLSFDILQVKMLTADYSSVVGKWKLERTIGNVQGYFTLLFKKMGQRWFIISDHSS